MPDNITPGLPNNQPSEAPTPESFGLKSKFPKPKKDEKVIAESKTSFLQRIRKRIRRNPKPVIEMATPEDRPEADQPGAGMEDEDTGDEGAEDEGTQEEDGVNVQGPSTINAGGFATLSASSNNEEDKEFEWESSDPMVVNVAGKESSAQAYGMGEGSATITATGDASGASGSHQITVKKIEEREDKDEKKEDEKPEGEGEPKGEAGEGAETETAEAERVATEAAEREAVEKAAVEQGAKTAAIEAAAPEAAAATGLAAAGPYILIGVAIILGIVVIIVLISLVLSALKTAGRTAAQLPDYNNSTDAGNAGAVLTASQTKDASLIAKAAGTTTQAAINKVTGTTATSPATNANLGARTAFAQTTNAQSNDTANQITTNANALAYGMPTDKKYVQSKITTDASLANSLPANSANQTAINDAKKQIGQINTDYSKYLSLDQPILQISPFDLTMIKSGQVDKRIIEVLKKLVDFSLAQTGDNKDRWSEFKIGRIYKASPYDQQETPLQEDSQNVSAHYFGEALDITVVGKLKCTTNYWVTSTSKWMPCNVSYQGGGPQNSTILNSQNYASFSIPDALSGAAATLGNIDTGNSRNFYDLFGSLGQQTIREEMGIDQSVWDQNTPFSSEKILASYFSQSTSIPIQAISQFLETRDTKSLDRGIVEAQLKLPAGSLAGSNWNEIYTNTYLSYTRQTLGLQGTGITDFNSNQELGKAILTKSFNGQTDSTKIFDAIKRSNTYYQNLWQLSDQEMGGATSGSNLTNLENLIGAKFKSGFMQTAGSASQTNWLGLPDGNLNDKNYQIAAGRYILAKDLNLSDQNQAFQNADYFLKNAPYSPTMNFDPCAGLSSGASCPAYNMFKDPNAFFQSVGNALNDKKNTDINFGGNLGTNLNKNLNTNNFNLNDLASILNNKKSALDTSLNNNIQSTLSDNLEIKTELPGIFSENRIQNGDFSFVIPLLGLNFVSRQATLPPNTLEQLFLPNVSVDDVTQELAGYQSLEALGVNPWGIDQSILPNNWYKDPQQFSTVALASWLQSYGLDIASLDKNGKLQLDINSFDQLVATLAGDTDQPTIPDTLAAFLGLGTSDLNTILGDIKGNKNNSGVQSLLAQTADQRLGLATGTTYNLLSGQLNINDWLKQSWQNDTLTNLASVGASQALGLPEGTTIDLNGLINGIKNNDSTQLTNFMLSVGQAKLGDTFQLPVDKISDFFNSGGDYTVQIGDLKNLAIEKLVQTIASNKDQYDTLIGLYNTYLQTGGNEQNLSTYISSILHIPASDANLFSQNNLSGALLALGASQIANQAYAVLGNNAIPYDEVRQIFFGDSTSAKPTDPTQLATYQANQNQIKSTALKNTGFSLADAAMIKQDPAIPVGTAQILAEGTSDQKNALLVNYVANKAGIPASLIQSAVLSGNFDISNINVADFVSALPGIGPYASRISQIESVFSDLQTFAKTNDFSSFSDASLGLVGEATGIPASEIQGWSNAIANPTDLNSVAFVSNEIGLSSAIDGIVGIPGFTNFALNAAQCIGSGGANLFSCFNAVLQVMNWLGFGKTTCENPLTTSQQQIRTTINQVLNTDPTPTKIITLRDQDVYHFAGLNDQGEVSQSLVDLLTQKYGPLDGRGNKGMFTSPTMWDHVHVGY